MAAVAGIKVVAHKPQLSSSWKFSDFQDSLLVRPDISFERVKKLGCWPTSSASASVDGQNSGVLSKGYSNPKRGSTKPARAQVAACASASATAASPSSRSGRVAEDDGTRMGLGDLEVRPVGDAATCLERSRLETQWTLLFDDGVEGSLVNYIERSVQGSVRATAKPIGKFKLELAEQAVGSAKVVTSGRPSARSRRLEARKRRLSNTNLPSPVEAFRIHPPKKINGHNKVDKPKKVDGVQDYLSTYLREITKIDRLTPDEEIMLSRKIRMGCTLQEEKKKVSDVSCPHKFERFLGHELSKEEWAAHMNMDMGDLEAKLHEAELARDRMVMANLRLVVSVAKQYNCEGLEVSDLIQEGSIGLLKGVERFDHTRGYKLSTYVHWWIRQGVTRAIADHSRTVRLPVHVHDTIGRIRRTRARLLQDGAPATVQSLSEALNISSSQVKTALKIPKKLKSLDMQVGHHRNVITGDNETFHSLVADQDAENHPWAIVEKAHMKVDVDKMLNTQLGVREREIIKLHYGVDSVDGYPMSLESISLRYGVSRERVRQLERAAKRKLQLTNQGLDKYCLMAF